MGYLLNSGSGFLKDAVQVESSVKKYLLNYSGYGYDTIEIGDDDFGIRVFADGGIIEGYTCASLAINELKRIS